MLEGPGKQKLADCSELATTTLFGPRTEEWTMTDEEHSEETGDSADEEKSFRERVEEIRQQRSEEGDEERQERMEEMMGGGGPGGMGGNPFAQMMGGMMGGGPGGPGGPQPGASETDNEEVVREIRQLRDEVRDVTRQLQRIADALED